LLEPIVNEENLENEREAGLLRVPLFIRFAAESYIPGASFSSKSELLERYVSYQLSLETRECTRLRKELKNRKWAYKALEDEPSEDQTRLYLQWLAQKLSDAEVVEFHSKWVTNGLTEKMLQVAPKPKPRRIEWLDTYSQKRLYRFLYLLILFISGWTINIFYSNFIVDTFLATFVIFLVFIPGTTLIFLVVRIADIILERIFGYSIFDVTKLFYFGLVWTLKLIWKTTNKNVWLSLLLIVLVVFLPLSIVFSISSEILSQSNLMLMLQRRVIEIINPLVQISPVATCAGVGAFIFSIPLGFILGVVFRNKGFDSGHRRAKLVEDEINSDSFIVERSDFFIKDKIVFLWIFFTQLLYVVGFLYLSELGIKVSVSALLVCIPLAIICILSVLSCNNYLDAEIWLYSPRRFILCFHTRVIPWNYAQFLNYCVERRLLQRIGDRYRFIHRELLDHFALSKNYPL